MRLLSGTILKLKINWDVALEVHLKRMGVGVVIRDSLGVVVTALSKTIQALQDPTMVEAIVALIAIEFSRDLQM